ncbi:MAG: ABC transporter ATP-binding protein [Chloroflexota bacterium]|nr:ABC transporter ATP-binding protein [Chloroflexota bacterium]MDE2853240.1 ABC transporter ATP-binding protein [Chloroflexota bacterium]MDE2948842.1 ABC transporter ATP-binding protein [Chloroflexota bacterium]
MHEASATAEKRTGEVLLDVRNLKKHFPIEKGFFRTVQGQVKAVDGVSFTIHEGETFGLVGESGSGKTTLGRCIVRGIEPTEGQIFFRLPSGEEVDIAALDKKELREVRKHFHMIFQDPYSSLDPRMSVLEIIAEPIRNNKLLSETRDIQDRVRELMDKVGLDIQHLNRYPHAFSGGQRQRIGIARSLAPSPLLIVCDEAVSALDVSIQAQILNLLEDLQEEFNLTFLFIAHDLSVVEHISDRVGVMYVGQLVEMADTESLFTAPKHPYTEALLSAVPTTDPEIKMDRIILPGEVANPAAPPAGCYFHPRCRYAQEICQTEAPGWTEVTPDHFAACHFADELELRGAEGAG